MRAEPGVVVCRRRSERMGLGAGFRAGAVRTDSARPTATSQPETRVAITRSAGAAASNR